MSEKNGFSVVAPTSTSRPSSTNGSSTSCCVRLKRCTSSRNRIVPWPCSPSRARARSATSRTSFTPAVTADSGSNAFSVAPATSRAIVVLPVPGGPHSTTDDSRSDSMSTRSGLPGPSRCCWPTTSSSERGRSRAASGARARKPLLHRRGEQVVGHDAKGTAWRNSASTVNLPTSSGVLFAWAWSWRLTSTLSTGTSTVGWLRQPQASRPRSISGSKSSSTTSTRVRTGSRSSSSGVARKPKTSPRRPSLAASCTGGGSGTTPRPGWCASRATSRSTRWRRAKLVGGLGRPLATADVTTPGPDPQRLDLHHALRGLSRRQREVLVLRFLPTSPKPTSPRRSAARWAR